MCLIQNIITVQAYWEYHHFLNRLSIVVQLLKCVKIKSCTHTLYSIFYNVTKVKKQAPNLILNNHNLIIFLTIVTTILEYHCLMRVIVIKYSQWRKCILSLEIIALGETTCVHYKFESLYIDTIIFVILWVHFIFHQTRDLRHLT